MNIKRILGDGVKTGAVLAVSTTAAILLASAWENKAPWAALNAVAHIVDGDEKEQPTAFSARELLLGLAVNATAMGAWGVLYEGVLEVVGAESTPAAGAVGAAAAFVIDYKVVPKRFTPGIEKKLSQTSVVGAYVVLAATLALSPLWNRRPD